MLFETITDNHDPQRQCLARPRTAVSLFSVIFVPEKHASGQRILKCLSVSLAAYHVFYDKSMKPGTVILDSVEKIV